MEDLLIFDDSLALSSAGSTTAFVLPRPSPARAPRSAYS